MAAKKKAVAKKVNPKMAKVMHEWKTGTLHSGKGGPVVKSQKQAIAIAFSEAMSTKKKATHRMPDGTMMAGKSHGSAKKKK
jgi:hypothetical protein